VVPAHAYFGHLEPILVEDLLGVEEQEELQFFERDGIFDAHPEADELEIL
jgi:hypothetical protein